MTDAYLMDPWSMSLSRYYQILRVAGVRTREEARHREMEIAWHAWQTTAHEFGSTKKKAPGLKEWMKMVGVQDDPASPSKPKALDEEGKKELMEKTMRIVAMDSVRTTQRAQGRGRKFRHKRVDFGPGVVTPKAWRKRVPNKEDAGYNQEQGEKKE